MNVAYEMLFETTIRTFLGHKACHAASQANSISERKKWYKKVLKVIVVKIQAVETTTLHKQQLSLWSERALKCTNSKDFVESELLIFLFRITGALLGLMGVRAANIATPMYYQSANQRLTEVIISGGDVMQDYYDKQDAITIRKKIVTQLKDEALTDYQISLVLNTTEYQIKKLRNNL